MQFFIVSFSASKLKGLFFFFPLFLSLSFLLAFLDAVTGADGLKKEPELRLDWA